MDGILFGPPALLLSRLAVFGATLLIHSTVIILIGLAGVELLRLLRKGAAARSLLLRLCLCAVLTAPAAPLVIRSLHLDRVRLVLTLPRPARETAPAAVGESPDPAPRAVSPAPGAVSVDPVRSAPPAPSAPALRPAAVSPTPDRATPSPGTAGTVPLPAPRTSGTELTGTLLSMGRTAARAALPAFALIWLACSAFFLVRAGVIILFIGRVRGLSRPARSEYREVCRSAAAEIGATAPPVLQSPYVTSAFLAGLLRPAILLPLGGNEDLMATREVFLHELAHLARRDHVWLHLGQLGKILFPLQPLLWALTRRMEEMSDFACDDYVLTHAPGGREYAARLVDIARSMIPGKLGPASGTGIVTIKSPLRRRIEHILDNSYARHITASASETMSFALLFLCTVTLTGFVGLRSEAAVSGNHRTGNHAGFGRVPAWSGVLSLARSASPAAAARDSAPREPIETSPETGSGAPSVTSPESGQDSPESVTSDPSGTPSPESEAPGAFTLLTDASSLAPDLLSRPEPPSSLPALAETAGESAAPSPSSVSALSTDQKAAPAAQSSETVLQPPQQQTAALPGGSRSGLSGPVRSGELVITAREDDALSDMKPYLDRGKQYPVWSPDGGTIAFAGHEGFGIWTVSAAGGVPKLVFDNRERWEYQGRKFGGGHMRTLGYSPNGRELTFVNYAFDLKQGSRVEFGQNGPIVYGIVPYIESMDLASGKVRVLARDAIDGCWASDGRRFVFKRGGDGEYTEPDRLFLLDTVTGDIRLLADRGACPCMTPDGAQVIYSDGDALFRVSLDGGLPEKLPCDAGLRDLECSPDGRWVLGTAESEESGRLRLMAFDLRNGHLSELPESGSGNTEMGAWSPTGTQFCYTATEPGVARATATAGQTIRIADFRPETLRTPSGTAVEAPVRFAILGNRPNPFNPSTTIEFTLPSEGPAELVIYNMAGQKVRELVTGIQTAGKHAVLWNGRDRDGKPVSSGVYFARLKMEGKVESRRMTLVK